MSPAPWNAANDVDDDATSSDRPRPTLVSLHFIRTALRRRLPVCVLAVILGVAAAASFMVAFPPAHAAKASLVLTYDPSAEPTRAMATNVSLLKTRTLALRTIEALGLPDSPDDFLGSLTVEPSGSELMLLTMTAPDDAEAVRRLTALTSTFLQFRGEQLSAQSQVLVKGLEERIARLQAESDDITQQLDALSKIRVRTASQSSQQSELVAQQTSIQDRIETLQQSVDDTTLRNSSVVLSSRVLDPPAAEPGRAKRTIALGLASGLIGGVALGCGTVLFLAITSDRLRRRSDVASALGVPVPISVGRITPLPKALLWVPPVHKVDRHRADERQRLAHAIEDELLLPHRGTQLVVAGIDNADELAFAVAEAARNLTARGSVVTVIDLTERGSHVLRGGRATVGSSDRPTVLRPRGLPALAHGAADLVPPGYWDDGEAAPSAQLSDVILILAELSPAVGADHLTAWTDRVIVVATAGRSSVEKARTIGDQVRATGLDFRFAGLLHTERTDDSSGTPSFTRPAPAPLQTEHEGPELTGRVGVR